ncbi:MAG: hypothetical protein ACHQVK_00215, partial [Candidatus Paceibacterales bacterium]
MEKKLLQLIIIIVIAVIVVVGLAFVLSLNDKTATPTTNANRVEGTLTIAQLADKTKCVAPAAGANLDDFAKCIKASGATFYGAFWCPHCKAQKDLFGSSVQYLPYVECSTPDGNSQLPVCTNAGVTVYPTWQF